MRRLLTAALAILALHAACAAEPPADPVVAERGSDKITLSAARALVAATGPELRQKLLSDPASLTAFLRNALLSRAVLEAAAAQKWEQRPEIAALLARTREQTIAQSFLASQAALPTSYPSDAEIEAAYEQNKQRFLQPRMYHLTQIALPLAAGGAPAAADAARRRLADLARSIGHGKAGFDAAGKQLAGAQINDLGWLPEPRLAEAVKAAVAGLPEGGVTDPVCAPTACYLLHLVATRPAGPAPLADARDALVRAMRQQKEQQGEQEYANTLLARSPVKVNEIELGRLAQSP